MSEKDILRQYQTYITQIIQPSCVLSLIDVLADYEEQIKAREVEKGPTEAAILMMECIYKLPETQGWFRMLLDSFRHADKALAHKNIVKKLRHGLNVVKSVDILIHMEEVLLPSQKETVQRVTDNPQWYRIFLEALRRGGYNHQVKILDDQDDDPAEKSGAEGNEEGSEEMEISFSEKAGQSNLSANTGSGKTVVAMEICRHHLEQSTEEKKKKVVFLANTIPLCQQQMEMFQKYFENTEFAVTGHFGENASQLAIQVSMENCDIIVMTPKLLEINLDEGSILRLSTFTLIFFDECHHTMKNHAYSAIMRMYMDIKLGPDPSELPQIVGLTASVGVGKSKNEQEAREHIYQLCANLDTDTISTVSKHLEELSSHVFVPNKGTD
ncbi:hypothetical protein JZ751_011854 [Albula glossodonta]|uniref:Helicase ATP-binding domain-containing protein n=1 Tax=Albula glossodonta TaxID=121402 RepID=A0A8T2PQS2_9TELE|nr:hypothetical protein JZ751_011854 [Albula glossodonta]